MKRERGVRVARPASEEFTEAVRWYETRRPGVVYRLEDDEILILAIVHMKRRPGFWKHRS